MESESHITAKNIENLEQKGEITLGDHVNPVDEILKGTKKTLEEQEGIEEGSGLGGYINHPV